MKFCKESEEVKSFENDFEAFVLYEEWGVDDCCFKCCFIYFACCFIAVDNTPVLENQVGPTHVSYNFSRNWM